MNPMNTHKSPTSRCTLLAALVLLLRLGHCALCSGLAWGANSEATREWDFNAMIQPVPTTAKFSTPDFNI